METEERESCEGRGEATEKLDICFLRDEDEDEDEDE